MPKLKNTFRRLSALPLVFVIPLLVSQALALTVTDRRGVSHTFEAPLKKVVFHVNYEFIPALDAWGQVAGLSNIGHTNDLVMATLPPSARIPIIGDIDKINAERILKVRPDAVITWRYNQAELDFIERRTRTPVVAYYPQSLDEFYQMFDAVGAMLGKSQRARVVVQEMQTLFSLIRARSGSIDPRHRQKILWLGAKPTQVCGRRDPKNDIIQMLGARNPAAVIVRDAGEVPLEQIVSWNPDLLFIVWHAPYDAKDLLANRQWRHVDAVRHKRIYKAPPWSTWSPRLAPIALWMAARTYPQRYQDLDLHATFDDFFQKVFGIPYAKIQTIKN